MSDTLNYGMTVAIKSSDDDASPAITIQADGPRRVVLAAPEAMD